MALGIDRAILGGGLIAIGATVFAESGLLIGFFLPGDTLLFGAGLLASQGTLPLGWLLLVVVISAIVGDNVGYSIGRRTGHRIFRKKDGVLFHHDQLVRAEKFYEKHGGKTIILARFIPVIRTFAPLVAGVGKMPRERFMFFNIIGAVLWGAGVVMLGYWLGARLPWLSDYITPVILGVIIISLLSAFIHLFKDKRVRAEIVRRTKLYLSNISLNKKVD